MISRMKWYGTSRAFIGQNPRLGSAEAGFAFCKHEIARPARPRPCQRSPASPVFVTAKWSCPSSEILDQHRVGRFRATVEGQASIAGPAEPEDLVRNEMRHRLVRACQPAAGGRPSAFGLALYDSATSCTYPLFSPCVFNNILASFVLFLCFFGAVPPGSLARFPGREIGESESPGMAHRLPKLRPERWARRLASELLDSLTPRLLDCTWRQKPQAGTRKQKRTHNLSGRA